MFTVILVLVIALLVFRRFTTWQVSAAYALAVMLVVTASAHFVPGTVTFMPNHDDLVAMVPPVVPFPGFVIYATGVLELAGAAGLVLTSTRRAAGLCLALLFVLLLPANIYAAVAEVPDASPLWLRIPEQIIYIAVALWAASPATRVRELMR